MVFALLAVLASAPSATSLASAANYRGALVPPLRLVVDSENTVPLSTMTREQLRAEYRKLEEARPGLGGQITMVVMGGVAMVAGGATIWFTLLINLFSFGSRALPLLPMVIGVGLLVGGAALLAIGIVLLRMGVAERAPYSESMDEIQKRLDGTWEEPNRPVAPPPRYEPVVPPPPPPPPPGAGWPTVPPSLVLARF